MLYVMWRRCPSPESKTAHISPNPSNLWDGDKLKETTTEEKKLGPYHSFAWALGNALSIVDVNGFEDQIIALCKNKTYGSARQMLVLGLARFHNAEGEATALELLNDDSVRLHAVIALGKMKSRRALPELENLMTDKTPDVKREARKAIGKVRE